MLLLLNPNASLSPTGHDLCRFTWFIVSKLLALAKKLGTTRSEDEDAVALNKKLTC